MAKILVPLILVVALISLLINFFFYQKAREDHKVIEVVDGDTFQLKSGERVRLMGVDAPELDRCGGVEAKQKLTDLILNKPVNVEETVKEKYGRTMGLVYLNGALINKIMMESGWGRPDYRKNTQRDALSAGYANAKKNMAGLWNFCINPKPPNNCLIKANIDTATYQKTYHLPGCKHYDEVVLNTAYGDSWFCTEVEVVKAGFEKAKNCK